MVNHVRKRLPIEAYLEAYIIDLKSHANLLVKDMWNVEGQIYQLTDSFYKTKDMKRRDHKLLELWTILLCLCNEFKLKNTQQGKDILGSQFRLTERGWELTRKIKEATDKEYLYCKFRMTMQDELERLQKNSKINRDTNH